MVSPTNDPLLPETWKMQKIPSDPQCKPSHSESFLSNEVIYLLIKRSPSPSNAGGFSFWNCSRAQLGLFPLVTSWANQSGITLGVYWALLQYFFEFSRMSVWWMLQTTLCGGTLSSGSEFTENWFKSILPLYKINNSLLLHSLILMKYDEKVLILI